MVRHWEGKTLVVETTNFIGGHVSVGGNGAAGPPIHRALVRGISHHARTRARAEEKQAAARADEAKAKTEPRPTEPRP
jgi:hypothetical protein